MNPEISIVIVNYNTRELLRACLRSIYRAVRGVTFETIVVDNASSDGSMDMVRDEFPAVLRVCNPRNDGFGVANNIGAAAASGRFLLLFNSDAELRSDTPSALVAFLREHPRAAAVGPRVLMPDGQRQPMIAGALPSLRAVRNDALGLSRLLPRRFPGVYDEAPAAHAAEVGWVSGVCVLVRSEAYRAIGGFDPRFFMYCEDIDLCRRLHDAGWEVWHLDDAAILHHGGGSAKTPEQRLRSRRMQQRGFVDLLGRSLAGRELLAARFYLGAGLVMRLGAGAARIVAGGGDRLLFASSAQRLADLMGLRTTEA